MACLVQYNPQELLRVHIDLWQLVEILELLATVSQALQ